MAPTELVVKLLVILQAVILTVCVIDIPYDDDIYHMSEDDVEAWYAAKREYNFLVEKRTSSIYTQEQKDEIVDLHNKYRRAVDPPGANIELMYWDEELATQAQEWSEKCEYNHPKGEDAKAYFRLGQNLYFGSGRADKMKPASRAMFLWFDERKDYHINGDKRCTADPEDTCGHYTQVVWASTKYVGCGANFCPSAIDRDVNKMYKNAWIITCNYSPPGNVYSQLPYFVGEPGSRCKAGLSIDGLCDDCRDSGNPDCVCKRQCDNCGTVAEDCSHCICPKGFTGKFCDEICQETDKRCGRQMKKRHCSMGLKYRNLCPVLCGVCEVGPPDVCEEDTKDWNFFTY